MKISTVLVFVLAFGALVYLALKWQGGTIERRSYATSTDHGAQLFAVHCASCHGANGMGARFSVKSEDEFRGALLAAPSPMPSFDGELSEIEMDALWTYVSSLPPAPSPEPSS